MHAKFLLNAHVIEHLTAENVSDELQVRDDSEDSNLNQIMNFIYRYRVLVNWSVVSLYIEGLSSNPTVFQSFFCITV